MKKILTLMLGLVAGTASFAHQSVAQPTASEAHVVMTTDHKIKLYVQPLQTNGQLAIWDASGQILYNSTVSLQKGLQQQFDLSNLGTGTYRLTLTMGKETLTKTFVIQADPNSSFIMQES